MRMKLLIFFVFIWFVHSVLFVGTAAFAAGSQIQASSENQLPAMKSEFPGGAVCQQALDQLSRTAGTSGVLVVSLPSGAVVCESRSKDVFVPASLMKLLTSYTALKKLGPAFRFETKVLAAGAPDEGVISGDIWIKGSGDPFFVSDSALQLAKTIREKGIRQIRGGIFVDNSFFQPSSERICLDSDCVGLYNPVVSAAAIDFNTLTVRVSIPFKGAAASSAKPGGRSHRPAASRAKSGGRSPRPGVDSGLADGYVQVNGSAGLGKKGASSVTLHSNGATGNGEEQFQLSGRASAHGSRTREFRFNAADPAGLFAHATRSALERAGVKVLGAGAREAKVPPGAEVIAAYDSPPLEELISSMNKYSNNFMAEMFLRSLGGYVSGAPGDSRKGVAVLRTTLGEDGFRMTSQLSTAGLD